MSTLLLEPSFPQAVDGVIRTDLLGGQPVLTRVPQYVYPVMDDVIRVLFGEGSGSLVVDAVNYAGPFFTVQIPASSLAAGELKVHYEVTSPAENVSVSSETTIVIASSPPVVLPLPTFPDAVRGKISLQKVGTDKHLRVRCTYSGMSVGDVLTVRWQGQNASGVDVPSSHTQISVTLTASEVNAKEVIVNIGEAYVTVLGDGGTGSASVSVKFIDGRMGLSGAATVGLVSEEVSPLVVQSMRLAPPWLTDVPDLYPVNWVSVLGAPGQVLKVETAPGSRVGDRVVHDPFNGLLRLDSEGRSRFWVALTDVALHPDYLVPVSLIDNVDPTSRVEVKVEFAPYKVIEGGRVDALWRVSTGADIGHDLPCTYYLHVLPKSLDVNVSLVVTGNGRFGGISEKEDKQVVAGGHLVAEVLDATAETIVLNMVVTSLDGSETAVATTDMEFVAPL